MIKKKLIPVIVYLFFLMLATVICQVQAVNAQSLEELLKMNFKLLKKLDQLEDRVVQTEKENMELKAKVMKMQDELNRVTTETAETMTDETQSTTEGNDETAAEIQQPGDEELTSDQPPAAMPESESTSEATGISNEEPLPKIGDETTNYSVDLTVPESPAFAVLGLSPQEVMRPTNPRALAAELLNGIDRNGNFQSGVAIDTSPFLLFNGKNITITEYRGTNSLGEKVESQSGMGAFITRLLTNAQLSLATAKGASEDDKSIRLASGVRITVFDRGDPRLYKRKTEEIKESDEYVYWLDNCFYNNPELIKTEEKILFEIPKELGPAEIALLQCQRSGQEDCSEHEKKIEEIENKKEQLIEDYKTRLVPIANQCRDDIRKHIWNNSALTFGVAPTWISTSGEADDIDWNGIGAWASLAYGFEDIPILEDTSQFIIHGRYRTDEEVPIEGVEGMFMNRDSLFVGTRLIVGNPDLAAEFEGGYTLSDPDNGDNENSFLFSVGGNIKITDNLWLELAIGGKSSDSNTDSQVFVLNSLKWGFQSAPTIK